MCKKITNQDQAHDLMNKLAALLETEINKFDTDNQYFIASNLVDLLMENYITEPEPEPEPEPAPGARGAVWVPADIANLTHPMQSINGVTAAQCFDQLQRDRASMSPAEIERDRLQTLNQTIKILTGKEPEPAPLDNGNLAPGWVYCPECEVPVEVGKLVTGKGKCYECCLQDL